MTPKSQDLMFVFALCADVGFQLQKADPGVSVAGATRRPPTPSAFGFSLASPPLSSPFASDINY